MIDVVGVGVGMVGVGGGNAVCTLCNACCNIKVDLGGNAHQLLTYLRYIKLNGLAIKMNLSLYTDTN